MGPKTRSMSSSTSKESDKIIRTLDPIQIKVSDNIEHLPLWRLALHSKYVGEYKPTDLLPTWKEYGAKHLRLTFCVNTNEKCLPPSLYQTSLQLHLNGRKLITFHLYHTTGTILVQGKACRQWVEEEFKRLQACVNAFASCSDHPNDLHDLHALLSPIDDDATDDETNIVKKSTENGVEKPPTDIQSKADDGQNDNTDTKTIAVDTAYTIVATDTAAASTSKKANDSDTSDANTTIPNTITNSNSNKETTDSKCSTVNTTANTDNNTIAVDTASNTMAVDTAAANISKSRTTDIDASDTNISVVVTDTSFASTVINNNSNVETNDTKAVNTACSTVATDSAAATSNNRATDCDAPDMTNINGVDTDTVSMDRFISVTQDLQFQICSLKAAMSEMRQHYNTEIDYLNTVIRHIRNEQEELPKTKPASKQPRNPGSTRKTAPPVNISGDSDTTTTTACEDTASTSIHKKPNPTSTSRPSVSSLHSPDKEVSPVKHGSHNNTADRKNTAAAQAETEWPELPSLPSDTETLVLGDSVLKNLHEHKMSADKEKTRVIAISGLDRLQLVHLLKGTEPSRKVKRVTIHIGINDCRRGHFIGKGAWRALITAVKQCFPSATLAMSSILPLNDMNQHITACIKNSNASLSVVCWLTGVTFIDNTRSFVTPDGTTKQMFYSDTIHPNTRGTSALAIGIKRHYSSPRGQ